MPRKAMLKNKRQTKRKSRRMPRILGSEREAKGGGHGDYTYSKPGPVGQAGRYLGHHAGRALGSYLGGSSGADIGGNIGKKIGGLAHYIGKLFGSGDYKVGAKPLSNILVNSRQIPDFVNKAKGSVICHSEYLGDVVASATQGAFQVQYYEINPGLSGSFPWLSAVAANFEEYEITGLIYEFKTMSSDLVATGGNLGTVIMSTDYNPADTNEFVNKQVMENYEFASSCKISQNMAHGVELAKRQNVLNERFIRSGAVVAGQDIQLYDVGTFSIATQGAANANQNLGELWVHYCVQLLKPRLYAGLNGQNLLSACYGFNNVTTSTSLLGNATSLADSIANHSQSHGYDNIGMISAGSGSQLVFPSWIPYGEFVCEYFVYAATNSNGAVVAPQIATINSSTATVTVQYASPGTGVSVSELICTSVFIIKILAPSGTGGYNAGFGIGLTSTIPNATNQAAIRIQQIPYGSF